MNVTIFAFTQDLEHLDYKGIPVNGNINDFAQTLVNKGVSISEKTKAKIVLVGEYSDIDESRIEIWGTPGSSTTYKIGELLPEENYWKSLKSKYFGLKEKFTIKYGVGKSVEYFAKPYREGYNEMEAAILGKCKYSTKWVTEKGSVSLEISTNGQIYIEYIDAMNAALADKEKRKAVMNEI